MQLILDYDKYRMLNKILMEIPQTTPKIMASVAFSSYSKLIDIVIKYNIEFEWWGLLNAGFSTEKQLIENALKHKGLIRFYPIKSLFHPKMIYIENYGLYIGSANMTRNALEHNIETGVFLDEDDIESFNFRNDILDYFDYLRDKFVPFTDDDLTLYNQFEEDNKKAINHISNELQDKFNALFSHLPENTSPINEDEKKKSRKDKRKNSFISEWRNTLDYLLHIMDFFEDSSYYPSWVQGTPNKGVMADQFLHAYYSVFVKEEETSDKSFIICKKLYNQNKLDKNKALLDALKWFKKLTYPPKEEDFFIHEWAPLNQRLLSKDKIKTLTVAELAQVYLHNHSAKNHAKQIEKKVLGLPPVSTPIEECTIAYAKWHYSRIANNGMSLLEILYFLIWDESEPIEERIYKVRNYDDYRISHLGESIIGEMIGWARPDKYPIRNNRVNKVLTALGYQVNVKP